MFVRLAKPNKETAKKAYSTFLLIGFVFAFSPIYDIIRTGDLARWTSDPVGSLLGPIFLIGGSVGMIIEHFTN